MIEKFFTWWLEEHYIGLLKKTIKKELGNEGRLEYSIIVDNTDSDPGPYTIKVPTGEKKATLNQPVSMPIDLNRGTSKEIPNPFIIPGLKKIKVNSQLIESYSFENFIEGDCNRLARSAGFAVAGISPMPLACRLKIPFLKKRYFMSPPISSPTSSSIRSETTTKTISFTFTR